MAKPVLADLIRAAEERLEPSFPPPGRVRPGGVDPLGLRQINFDLMDQVFPGLNNTATHIRPFVVTAWSWGRAASIADRSGLISVDVEEQLRDFVDRVEVIYAWSQFLRDRNAELPGSHVLQPFLSKPSYVFGGQQWLSRRKERRYSTAFGAPALYGPGLKTFGWLVSLPGSSGVLVVTKAAQPALAAFEALIQDRLDHPAFNQFGPVEVTRDEVLAWAEAWALDRPSELERKHMANALVGQGAPASRRNGGELTLQTVARTGREATSVRDAMCRPTNEAPEPQSAWSRVQLRQLFRLSLEGLFRWVVRALQEGPRSTRVLVEELLSAAENLGEQTVADWLSSSLDDEIQSVELIGQLQDALWSRDLRLEATRILEALHFCLSRDRIASLIIERPERLPLMKAWREVDARRAEPLRQLLSHVLDGWIIGQHTFWSVGRGLADARAGGKTILRLRIVLEEGGWALTRGAGPGNAPVPTPDRLGTVLSLTREAVLH